MISIVIPAYQEAARLPATLAALESLTALPAGSPSPNPLTIGHVVAYVVDDGSSDSTAALASAAQKSGNRIHVIRHDSNRGKGAAVRTGVLAATAKSTSADDFVWICDADLSAPLDQFVELLSELISGADIAIGSRDLPNSRLDPPQPRARRLLAWSFRALRRMILLPRIRDTQCGFKLFRASVAANIFPRTTIDGWLGDLEVLAIADRLGYKIAEVGVTWRDSRDSRVRPLADARGVLRDLFRIRRIVREMEPSPRKP